MKVLVRTLPYLRGHWLAAGLVVVLLTLEVVAQLLIPWTLKLVVDNVLGGQPLTGPLEAVVPAAVQSNEVALLVFAVVAGFLLTLASQSLGVFNTYVQIRIDQGMVLRFRSALFRHAQRLSIAIHDQRKAGDLVHRINYSASALGQVPLMIPVLLQATMTLVGMFVITMSIDTTLAVLSLAVVPFLFLSIRYYARGIQPRINRVVDREIESLSIVQETLAMLRVIVSFGREEQQHQRFLEQGQQTVDARVRVTVGQTLFSFAVTATTAAGTALVLGIGAHQVLEGQLTLGQLLVILSYIAAVYAPLDTLVSSATPLQQHIVDLRKAFELIDEQPEIVDAPDAVTLGPVRGAVEFEGVSFAHKGRQETLRDISFSAEPGTVTAFVGPTGAGKTTLANLMPRLYEPERGIIRLDGRDIRGVTLESLRRQFSIVLQETLLFSASVRENIAYGDPNAAPDRIIEAARSAGAHDFIIALPDGYDTLVGEGGRGLSGGERQRISIARAFLRDAPILILDEPTSAVDGRTEAAILAALEQLSAGRTTFIIAHRLSTVRHADQILVLEDGYIRERGTHQVLLSLGGLYSELVAQQTPGEPGAASEAPPLHLAPVQAESSMVVQSASAQ